MRKVQLSAFGVSTHSQTYEYKLLRRLQQDCEYFLNEGSRSDSRLWAGNVEDQILEMKRLWGKLKVKPEWLSEEDIEDYAKKMGGKSTHAKEGKFHKQIDEAYKAMSPLDQQAFKIAMLNRARTNYDSNWQAEYFYGKNKNIAKAQAKLVAEKFDLFTKPGARVSDEDIVEYLLSYKDPKKYFEGISSSSHAVKTINPQNLAEEKAVKQAQKLEETFEKITKQVEDIEDKILEKEQGDSSTTALERKLEKLNDQQGSAQDKVEAIFGKHGWDYNTMMLPKSTHSAEQGDLVKNIEDLGHFDYDEVVSKLGGDLPEDDRKFLTLKLKGMDAMKAGEVQSKHIQTPSYLNSLYNHTSNHATDKQVAETILEQMGGSGRIKAMIGAKNFIALKQGLSFKFPRGQIVQITLNGKDLYDMEFGTMRGLKHNIKKTYKDIYNDQLKEIFEKQTGLYLSL